ncbi:unnamed protein product [Bursaphelenchus xylophilus]|uniref:(pine wood nematode) hypothetical protein n=1 Tax=Bursaphelenchus xylophilus TaxID=6326 RepID=A0A1I7RP08_BURXY|nr:unnamed protein product [Bursaphelenchus xylophilus]CAG9124432.1 unnamed protein product [Bursaphelenchus xylophilus]
MIWKEIISNIALSCVIGVALLLVIMVVFLFLLVLSLTFDCWWTIGRFFNIEEDTQGLLGVENDPDARFRRPWMIRLQNGKVHTVKPTSISDLEMV